MKLIRNKIFYVFYKYAMTTSSKSNANETAIALLSCVSLGYFSPLVIMLIKLLGIYNGKTSLYLYFGFFAFSNYYLISKYYKSSIKNIIEFMDNNGGIKKHEKYLISFFSYFSFFFFLGTLLLLRYYDII